MENNIIKTEEICKRVSKQSKLAILSTLIVGYIVHGYMIFNKLSFHDDIGIETVGSTYDLGRWMLGWLSNIVGTMFGNYSLPGVLGFVTILWIALSSVLMIKLLDIKESVSCILVGALMVVFPTVTSLFGYMFTAAYFSFAFLGALWIVYLEKNTKGMWSIIVGIITLACMLGIYQASIAITVCGVFFVISMEVMYGSKTVKDIFVDILKYGITVLLGVILYLFINKIVLNKLDISMSSYKGMDSMGKIDIPTLWEGVKRAYNSFFDTSGSMYVDGTSKIYYVVIVVLFLIFFHKVFFMIKKKEYARAVFIISLLATLPIAINFMDVLTDTVYSLNQYTQVYILVYLLTLVEKEIKPFIISLPKRKHFYIAIACLMAYMVCSFAYYDNKCYVSAEIIERKTMSWFNGLIANIKDCDGYYDTAPIMWVNSGGATDSSYFGYSPLNNPEFVEPYGIVDLRNNYNWKLYILMFCGFSMPELDPDTQAQMMELEEVQNMPSYPNDGAIRVINGIVVVKL